MFKEVNRVHIEEEKDMNRKEFMAARSTERAHLIKISCAEGDCKRDFVWEYLKKNS